MKALTATLLILVATGCVEKSEDDVASDLTAELGTLRTLRDRLAQDFDEQAWAHIGRKRVGDFVTRDGVWFPRGRPQEPVSFEAVAQSIGLSTESLQDYLGLLRTLDAEFVQHHPGHSGYASIEVSSAPTWGCSASVHWQAVDEVVEVPPATETPLSRWTALDDTFLMHWFCE